MGRDKKNEQKTEQYTKMVRRAMETDAWRALPPTAQALYPWLKMEWRGPSSNNNGKLSLSLKQAAERIGCSRNTASKAFHHLQAKGFLVQKEAGVLGFTGMAKAPTWELTELPVVPSNTGRKLYEEWREGHDFAIDKAAANNAKGLNGKEANRYATVIPFQDAKR